MDYPGRFADHIDPTKLHVISLSFAVRSLELSYGGTAGNIAYNLALLGLRAEVVSSIGRDGAEYLARLRKLGLGVRCVQAAKDTVTAGAYIITDRSDNQITGFFPGAMLKPVILPAAGQGDTAIVAADAPGNMRRLAAHYLKNGVPYIFDPGQQITALGNAEIRRMARHAAVVVGNDYEMALIAKQAGLRREPRQVFVTTLGPKGSLIEQDGAKYRIPPAKAGRVVDPTGAGDAWRAGFIFGWTAGRPLTECGRLGSTVAVYAVENQGTQAHRFNLRGIKKRYWENFKSRLY